MTAQDVYSDNNEAAKPAQPKRSRPRKTPTPEEWRKEWEAWSEQVTKAWRAEKSAAEIVSEIRR